MSVRRHIVTGLFLGLLAAGSSGAACNPQSDFACSTTEDCVGEAGAGALCEANAFCSLPDLECMATGRRWHDRAGPLAGECVEPGQTSGTATDTDTDTDTDASTSDTTNSTTTMTTTMTTATTMTATTMAPTMTAGDTTGMDTSTGGDTMAAMTCDEQYGTAAGYELCEELPDSCSFNAELMMVNSCDDICTMFGGTCVAANLNDMVACESTGATTCDDAASGSNICVCDRA